MEDIYYNYDDHFTKCWVPELNSWVSSQWLSRKLKQIGMTSQQWYDKYILNIDDAKSRPICNIEGCPNKGKELPFLGPTLGYANHCNQHCKSLDPAWHELQSNIAKEAWKSESYRIASSISHSNPSDDTRRSFSIAGTRTWSNDDYYYNQSAKIALGTALHYQSDTAAFYYVVFNDCIKIGFSTDPSSRLFYVNGLNKEHHVYEGSLNDAAYFEYNSKIKYIKYNIRVKGTEYFDKSIINELKNDLAKSSLKEIFI